MIVVVILVLTVIGLLYWAYTENNDIVQEVEELNLFKEDISCNSAGDCISFMIPDVEDAIDTIQCGTDESCGIDGDSLVSGEPISEPISDSEPTEGIIDGVSTNSTDPTESNITGEIIDQSITRTGEIVQDYSYLGDHMRVQIGNGAVIQGNIKILDPNTGQVITPQLYKYFMTIECSEINEFCNLTPLSNRGITETDGYFYYKWTTNTQQHRAGLYDVSIYATSESVDSKNKKISVEHTMFLELFS